MSTELLARGGIMSKIKISGMLKNITDNEITEFTTTAIKQKDKYKFIVNNEKYILTIITPNKIIMNRNNNEIEQTMYFEKNKTISSIYTLKENNITINIDVLTNEIELTAAIKFYNDGVVVFNKLISSFPSNILAFFKHFLDL